MSPLERVMTTRNGIKGQSSRHRQANEKPLTISPAVQRQAVVPDLAHCDAIIDARTPAEFALDHVPGAINCPVLSDEERVLVGTLYNAQGAFEARRVGGAMVAANLATHLRTTFAERPRDWKPIVYCWRGGLRSGAMVQWLRLVGWDARQLNGGYKQWRKHVVAEIERIAPQLDLRVLCGPTGTAKTRILNALADAGAQILDLEACADHKGSVLGGVPGVEQPSQRRFETRIATVLEKIDCTRPLFVEAESRKIGRLSLPTPLLDRMRASECIEVVASLKTRLAYLLRDYAYLADDPELLAGKIATLHGLQSNETLARWQAWARTHDIEPLFAELMTMHYDPLYSRSQHGNYTRLRDAAHVLADALAESDLPELATRIKALAAWR